MVKNIGEFVILLIQVGVLLVILGFFIYRRIKLKISSLNWFIWIFVLAIAQAGYELILWILIEYGGYTSLEIYTEIYFIIYGLALMVLFFFLEHLEYNKPRFWSSSLVIALWAIFVALYFYDISYGVQDPNLDFEFHISSYFFDILQLVIMGQAVITFYRIFKKANFKRLKFISVLFLIAFIVLEIVCVLELTEHIAKYSLPDYDIPNAYFFTAVFLYLAVVYLAFPYYVFLAPYDVNNIILLNSVGLVIYNCRLSHDENIKDKALLIGGAVSGLEQFLKSFFDTKDNLKSIKMENKTLIMATYSNLSVMAIVERSSFILRNAMRQLLKEIIEKHPELDDEQSQIIINSEKTESFSKIVARVFPFIQSDDVFPIQIGPTPTATTTSTNHIQDVESEPTEESYTYHADDDSEQKLDNMDLEF